MLNIKDDIRDALAQGQPVLALESTIISHGMPYPQNIEMALRLEKIAREAGVVPATIAVMNGEICIGLDETQIEALGQAQNARKLSRADLADCIAKKDTGATTVAATMNLAKRAGIHVFATGGIGGVHQGVAESFDISADLEELSKTRMVVICAGAKAILDLAKTYEVLETKGVPVYAYQSDEIPAFYSRSSGIAAPLMAQTASEIAHAYALQIALDLPEALLVNNPIPSEHEIPSDEILPIIADAIAEANAKNIQTKAVTPFLLDQIYQRTKGRSLSANIALVENNVRLGTQIALEFASEHDI